MKTCLPIICCLITVPISLLSIGQIRNDLIFINPTGTYVLGANTLKNIGESSGRTGQIEVKLLDSSRIAISLFICVGPTSFNSGSFVDTIKYLNNRAIHRTPNSDTSCRINFSFCKSGVSVVQHQENLNFGCDFGHSVFADGFYKKISSKIPVIEMPDQKDKFNMVDVGIKGDTDGKTIFTICNAHSNTRPAIQ